MPERGAVRPLNPHEFDALVMGKLGFERDGLVLAQDAATGRLGGFVHAGFGPREPLGPSHRLDRSMGTIALLATDNDDPAMAQGLLRMAEGYLRSRGATVIYAGGRPPLDPFYRGIYGGSEFSGILGSHNAFVRAVRSGGYEAVAESVLFEADLAQPEPRDPRAPLLRRQYQINLVDDAHLPGWWDSLALGLFRPTHYALVDKTTQAQRASAWTWEVACGFAVGDGRSRVALIDVEVDAEHRRKGLGRHLVAEIMRRARDQNTDLVTVQTDAQNAPALALYPCLGFEPIDTATLYRLPTSSMDQPSGMEPSNLA